MQFLSRFWFHPNMAITLHITVVAWQKHSYVNFKPSPLQPFHCRTATIWIHACKYDQALACISHQPLLATELISQAFQKQKFVLNQHAFLTEHEKPILHAKGPQNCHVIKNIFCTTLTPHVTALNQISRSIATFLPTKPIVSTWDVLNAVSAKSITSYNIS